MNPRTRFRWVAKNKGACCHQMKCTGMAVKDRLCADHYAWWMSHGQQPAMPDYEHAPVDAIKELRGEAQAAQQEYKRLSGLPMRTLHDASAMHDAAKAARDLVELTRQEKRSSIKPLLEQIRAIKREHDVVIKAYTDCAALAELKLSTFDHLHDFQIESRPPPKYSGIPQAMEEGRVIKRRKRA